MTDMPFDQIERAVRDVATLCSEPFVLAVPAPLGPDKAEELLASPAVDGLILQAECADAAAARGIVAGRFVPGEYRWQLPPGSTRTLVFLGPRSDLSFRMVSEALRRGVMVTIYAGAHQWIREYAPGFLARRVYERAASDAQRLRISTSRLSGRLVHRLAPGLLVRVPFRTGVHRKRLPLKNPRAYPRRMSAVLGRVLNAPETPLLPAGAFDSENVLLVNSSLAWGGAERQIVNTLCGLHDRGYGQAELLCEHIHDRPDHDFYLWHLERAGIGASQIAQTLPLARPDALNQSLANVFTRYLRTLPPGLSNDIMRFAREFLERRPGVVHAWQDSTSIRAGLAAALVGVPRIVLSGRNMAPHRFNYFLPYMAPGYRALAALPQVELLNNSHAGARDYAAWLQLPVSRFTVLFNGIQDDAFRQPKVPEVEDYRRALGIPDDAPVVGSVFRFYPEKDPLLWIETAARVSAAIPQCWFVLVGTGILEQEIRARADALGLGPRLLLPGTDKDPARSMSAMDVFLLTSRIEGTPNVVIEAQWLGVPVVATSAGGTADTVDSGSSGYVIDDRNADKLAARVIELLRDEDARQQAGRRAAEFVRTRFGFERMVDETLGIYGLEPRRRQSA